MLLALAGGAELSHATPLIPDRGTLERLLGDSAVNEHFEMFPVDPFGAMPLDAKRLDAETVTNGHGPGLVVPGIAIEGPGGLQWNGRGYFGQPSRTLSGGSTLDIDFTSPVVAFGLDLLVFSRFPDIAQVSVFGADDRTLLGTFGVLVLDPSFEVFFGFFNEAGIGRVSLAGTAQSWSPVIDDLTFGTSTVPEPAIPILLLMAAAAAARRRRRRSAPE